MKKLPVIFISLLIGASSLWAQQIKLYVKADKTVIYAEPSENSYKIDTVKRGTVLTLFEKGIESSEWIYVTFQSERWKGKVTGFIKTDLVFTEEEMLQEDQMRMEEETPAEVAPETEEASEAEMKTEAETKPQEELPDLKAAFAKKKVEEKEIAEKAEVESPEAAKKEEAIEKPEPALEKEEIKQPEAEIEKEAPAPEIKEEVEEKEPVRIVEIDGVTESPFGRIISLPQTGEMAEMRPYAIIKREFKPPPPVLKAEEKLEEKAQTELQADVIAVKEEQSPPEEEEKEILEETPQAQEIVAPEAGIAEVEVFKKPEPPPPIVTVLDGITESPMGRSIFVMAQDEMTESPAYDFIEIETPVATKVEEEAEPEEEEIVTKPLETEEKPEAEAEEESQAVKPPEQVVKPPEQVVKPTELEQPKLPRKEGFFSFGFGYGPTWGGLGGAIQLNLTSGLSLHIGGGLYPTNAYYSEYDWVTNEWLYSVGIKYYFPFGGEAFRPYVDLMYGGIAVEAVQVVKEIWYYEYTYENIQKVLYGPSLVAGADLKLGFFGLNGFLGLSYNTTPWDYWDRDYFLNGGLGVSLYF